MSKTTKRNYEVLVKGYSTVVVVGAKDNKKQTERRPNKRL